LIEGEDRKVSGGGETCGAALAGEERKLLACIHCGLCLEACPTYVQTGDENDGPRGRIYLMRAVEEGRLAASSASFERHINRCLGCRACESACPAGVEYGQLLEAARADLRSGGRRRGHADRLLGFVLRRVWSHPRRLRLAFAAARLLRDTRLVALLLSTKLPRLVSPRAEFALALLANSAPTRLRENADGRTRKTTTAAETETTVQTVETVETVETAETAETAAGASTSIAPSSREPSSPAREMSSKSTSEPSSSASSSRASSSRTSSSRASSSRASSGGVSSSRAASARASSRVQLFKGCVTEGLFARVNRATVRVLAANGCAAEAPAGQVCCGALHAHAGDLEGARALARRNIDAFDGGDTPHTVVTNAGGCGAMLASYAQLLAHDAAYSERARLFSARVRDVSQQLVAAGLREGAPLGGELRTTYDASCHLLHGQRAADEPLAVLAAVPGLAFVPLEGSDVCCGGAGVYNLLEPELSARVLAEKLARLADTGARVVATGNPGCHMQIGAGARLAGLDARACHPVELLDESYHRAGFYDQAEG
jgi:glycolate oxidase iron-sulfur subunit